MSEPTENIIANGEAIPTTFPCTLEEFLLGRNLLPKSVVVELNREAISPSQFKTQTLKPNDQLEIVKIVAGG